MFEINSGTAPCIALTTFSSEKNSQTDSFTKFFKISLSHCPSCFMEDCDEWTLWALFFICLRAPGFVFSSHSTPTVAERLSGLLGEGCNIPELIVRLGFCKSLRKSFRVRLIKNRNQISHSLLKLKLPIQSPNHAFERLGTVHRRCSSHLQLNISYPSVSITSKASLSSLSEEISTRSSSSSLYCTTIPSGSTSNVVRTKAKNSEKVFALNKVTGNRLISSPYAILKKRFFLGFCV
mmetsp:Transcript_32176/g.54520  ORF Transcript_32176/g.54520 Transcript_32176/m.54520 type:complete len:236 (+) Transcript_32176:1186-1893(+)